MFSEMSSSQPVSPVLLSLGSLIYPLTISHTNNVTDIGEKHTEPASSGADGRTWLLPLRTCLSSRINRVSC